MTMMKSVDNNDEVAAAMATVAAAAIADKRPKTLLLFMAK